MTVQMIAQATATSAPRKSSESMTVSVRGMSVCPHPGQTAQIAELLRRGKPIHA
jgi:GTP cyclohydrolase FolE2